MHESTKLDLHKLYVRVGQLNRDKPEDALPGQYNPYPEYMAIQHLLRAVSALRVCKESFEMIWGMSYVQACLAEDDYLGTSGGLDEGRYSWKDANNAALAIENSESGLTRTLVELARFNVLDCIGHYSPQESSDSAVS